MAPAAIPAPAPDPASGDATREQQLAAAIAADQEALKALISAPAVPGEAPLTDSPDLVKLADAYGCLGLRARTLDELDAVIDQAFANDKGPTIVDVRVKRDEKVYPMVPSGAPLNDMIDGD